MGGNQSYQSRACLPTLFIVFAKNRDDRLVFFQLFAVFLTPVLRNTVCWCWYGMLLQETFRMKSVIFVFKLLYIKTSAILA